MKILIVDDSRAMQNILAKSIKNIGYESAELYFANDAEQAQAQIAQHRPQLVLSDLHMPGKSGLELLEALKSSNDPAKVIIVTIDTDPSLDEKVTALGGSALLRKPFRAETLFEVINRVVERDASEQSDLDEDGMRAQGPGVAVLSRLLSSLAGSEIRCSEVPYTSVNFEVSPFYGATLENSQSQIALAVFMDRVAANLVSAIIECRSLDDCAELAGATEMKGDTRRALTSFFGILSALCKPDHQGHLLAVHAEQLAREPHKHLKPNLDRFSDAALAIAIDFGHGCEGRMIFSFTKHY